METKQDKIKALQRDNKEGYWEYKVININDDYSGCINPEFLEKQLNELGLEGWHLKCAYTNEIGRTSSTTGAFGVSESKNATIDQNILIFERFVKIHSIEEEKRIKEEEEEKQRQLLEERKKEIERRQAERKAGKVDNRVVAFLASIEESNRFMDIYKKWKDSGLEGDLLFGEIEEDLKKRANIERLYGAGMNKNPEVYKKYISELKDKLL